MNPNDTEESIWAFLCEAQLNGFQEARRQILTVGVDPRPVMRTAMTLFRGDDDAKSIASLEELSAGGGSDCFYSSLYLGLFYEAGMSTASSVETGRIPLPGKRRHRECQAVVVESNLLQIWCRQHRLHGGLGTGACCPAWLGASGVLTETVALRRKAANEHSTSELNLGTLRCSLWPSIAHKEALRVGPLQSQMRGRKSCSLLDLW